MGLNDIFDKIYCINLEHRHDRWENCEKQFNKFNITVEKFNAVNGKEETPNGVGKLMPGEVGVIRSNFNVIKDAKEKGYKSIVIFEDDVELCENFNEKFMNYYDMVPKDWCFLYMGGNHVGGVSMINENIGKMNHTYAIHAICVKEDLYDHILEMLKEERVQVDVTYAQLQKIFPSYVIRPHLAWQKDGYSDIQGGYQDYNFLK